MAKQALVQKRFDGGWSPDDKLGPAYSFAYSRSLDFRKAPSVLTMLPGPTQEGKGIIVDLIQNTTMDLTGKIYALGDQGNFYRRTTAGVWTREAKLDDGCFGMVYRSDLDKIFCASSKTLSEYALVSSNPTMYENKYAESVSTDTAAVLSGGTALYTLPTSINESPTDKQEFTLDIEPMSKIKVRVNAKGTGDWTLTLHDDAHNTLATKTMTNASLNDGTDADFTFSSQVRIYVKPNARTYHFHLTSTVADGSVYCATGGDLNTCDFSIYADRLIDTKNGMHPMAHFLQYILIGNGNYLSVWEPLSNEPSNLEFLRHRLTFPAGYEVCGVDVYQEYAAIACEKVSDSGSPQDGIIFFWDGLSSTYNYFLQIPEGSPYGMHAHRDVLYYEAGGDWYAYTGGSPYKIRRLPNTDSEYSDTTDRTVTYPYMATVRRGAHLFGFPSETTNPNIEHGVYSFGATNKDFAQSFGFNYVLSTGDVTGTSIKIGHVKNYSDTLFTSWYNGTDYGLDVVDNNSNPANYAEWQSLWTDNGALFKQKSVMFIMVTHEPLPDNVRLFIKYRLNRGDAWTYSEAFTAENTVDAQAKFSIAAKRYYQIQYGFELRSVDNALTETPIITSINLIYSDNREEQIF